MFLLIFCLQLIEVEKNDYESFLSKKRLKESHDFAEKPKASLAAANDEAQADSTKKRRRNFNFLI